MDWFRRTLTPKVREKDSQKEVEAARRKAKESGEASLFEYDDTAQVFQRPGAPLPPTKDLKKALALEVCFLQLLPDKSVSNGSLASCW